MTKEANENLDRARAIIEHVGRESLRWGKLYDITKDPTFSARDITEAAATLMVEFDERSAIKPEELTKLKRQLTASKAREGKLKKQIAQLKQRLTSKDETMEDLANKLIDCKEAAAKG